MIDHPFQIHTLPRHRGPEVTIQYVERTLRFREPFQCRKVVGLLEPAMDALGEDHLDLPPHPVRGQPLVGQDPRPDRRRIVLRFAELLDHRPGELIRFGVRLALGDQLLLGAEMEKLDDVRHADRDDLAVGGKGQR